MIFRSLIVNGPRQNVWFLCFKPQSVSSKAQVSQTDGDGWPSQMMTTAGQPLISTQPLINTPSATTVLQKVTLRETRNESDTLSPSCPVHFFSIPVLTYYIFTSLFLGKHIFLLAKKQKRKLLRPKVTCKKARVVSYHTFSCMSRLFD